MRKLLLLPLAVLSTFLLSCDGKESSSNATGSGKEFVRIAPRIVRTAAISDELWNSTALVYAGLYDEDGDLIPGTLFYAPFEAHGILLPPIDANLVVSISVWGEDSTGTRLWYGWTPDQTAGEFSAGVGIGTSISIYPSTPTTTIPPSDSLVGAWTFVNDYVGTDGFNYRDINFLVVNTNGTYTINSVTKLYSGTLYFYGYFETGTWSSPQHQLTVTPQTYKECADLTTGCDTRIGSSSSLYTDETPTGARSFSWYISDGDIHMQDLANSLNTQIWSPYSP